MITATIAGEQYRYPSQVGEVTFAQYNLIPIQERAAEAIALWLNCPIEIAERLDPSQRASVLNGAYDLIDAINQIQPTDLGHVMLGGLKFDIPKSEGDLLWRQVYVILTEANDYFKQMASWLCKDESNQQQVKRWIMSAPAVQLKELDFFFRRAALRLLPSSAEWSKSSLTSSLSRQELSSLTVTSDGILRHNGWQGQF
jgi:hypothetical protein